MSRDGDGRPLATLSLAERLGSRGFMRKLAMGATGLAGALAGLPKTALAVAGTVPYEGCNVCNNPTRAAPAGAAGRGVCAKPQHLPPGHPPGHFLPARDPGAGQARGSTRAPRAGRSGQSNRLVGQVLSDRGITRVEEHALFSARSVTSDHSG